MAKADDYFEMLYGEDGRKISELVRKHHFYTAWKNQDKAMMLFDVAEKVRADFNAWKSKELNIQNHFVWTEARWLGPNGGWWVQADRGRDLMLPFENRLENDWDMMHCFHHNYNKARYEFIRLIGGDY